MKKENGISQSTQKIISAQDGKEIISMSAEYFRFSKAAEILRCSPEDLLHFGAVGKVEIMAPVLAKGNFEWPIDGAGIPFPEINQPIWRYFDETDRVILSMRHLAQIEAVGYSIVEYFFAPTIAKKSIDNLIFTYEDYLEQENNNKKNLIENVDSIREKYMFKLSKSVLEVEEKNSSLLHFERYIASLSEKSTMTEDTLNCRKIGYQTAWHPATPILDQVRTTIEHLFISKEELQRLEDGKPQSVGMDVRNAKQVVEKEKPPHKNAENNAVKREPVLKLAIYCLANFYSNKISASDLCRKMEEKAPLFWPETAELPMAFSTVEELCRETIKGNITPLRMPPKA